MKSYFFLLVFFCLSLKLSAQKDSLFIKCISFYRNDSVFLRWAPTKPVCWLAAKRLGFKIERAEVMMKEQKIGPYEILTAKMNVFSKEQLIELAGKNPAISVLLEFFYPENPDGGYKIGGLSALKRKIELNEKFGYALLMCDLDPQIAKAAGLFFVDPKALKNKRYIYRIGFAEIETENQLEPCAIVVDTNSPDILVKPESPVAVFTNKNVKLVWNSQSYKNAYTGFLIERGLDAKHFQTITRNPIIYISDKAVKDYTFNYNDSLVENDKTYYYRIKGINSFGFIGTPSDPISGKCFFNKNGVDIDTLYSNQKGKTIVKWKAIEDKNINGILILKAEQVDGVYKVLNEKLLSVNKTEFVDKEIVATSYYKLKTFYKNGQTAESPSHLFIAIDSIPPIAPTGLKGKIDSTGIVRLEWLDNKEKDLHAYRIFKANALHELFLDVGKGLVFQSKWNDTISLGTLTNEIYYKIVALDSHFNLSNFSEILKLEKPDTIAPAAGNILNIELKKGILNLLWEQSPSTDVFEYQLQRRRISDSVFRSLQTISLLNWTDEMIDTTAKAGDEYLYRQLVVDRSGNKGIGGVQFFRMPASKKSTDVILNAKVDRDKREIKLSWICPQKTWRIMLLRGIQNNLPTEYKVFDSNIESFTDLEIYPSNTYCYQLIIYTDTNTFISKPILIEY